MNDYTQLLLITKYVSPPRGFGYHYEFLNIACILFRIKNMFRITIIKK